MQGAWAIALSRHAHRDEVCVGVTRAARHGTVEGTADMVGCLINTIPLRVHVPAGARACDWLHEVRALSVEARPHEQASLSALRELAELPPGTPLFRTLIVFERYALDRRLRALGGPWRNRRISIRQYTDFPLTLAAQEDEGALRLGIEYERGRYAASDAARLVAHVRALLSAIARRPDAPLAELEMLEDDERAALMADAGGDGRLADVEARTWPEAFLDTVTSAPDALALVDGQARFSYAALERASASVATRLAENGVCPGDVVGVLLPRSPRWAAALIGTLRAGATYLPLDPSWPEERRALVLADAGAHTVVSDPGIDLGDAHVVFAVTPRQGEGSLTSTLERGPEITPRTPAYLLYTSGSTGRPKGVLVSHGALLSHARAIVPAFELTHADRCLQFTSQSFDVSLEETLPTWLAGGAVVLRSEGASTSFERFLDGIERDGVSVLNLPSAFFAELAWFQREHDRPLPSAVRLLVVGGEKPGAPAYAAWRRQHPEPRFLNAYGPTEVTITSTFCDPRACDVPADGRTEIPNRPPARCHPRVRPRPARTPRPRGRAGGAGAGRAAGRAGLPRARAGDPNAILERRLRPGGLALPDGRPRPANGRRRAPLPRARGRPDQNPRLPDRAGRDRERAPRGARSPGGGGGPTRAERRHAAGGLGGAGPGCARDPHGDRAARRAPARPPRLHGPERVRAPRRAAGLAERQDRSPTPPGAGGTRA